MEEIKLSVIQEEDIALSHDVALRGDKGTTFHPSVSEDGVISWTNDGNETNPDPINIRGPQGFTFTPQMNGSIIQWINNGDLDNPPPVDIRGPIGYVYTPTLSSDGILSWTNNGGLQNPNSVSLVGPRGPQGEPFTIAKTFNSIEEMNAGFDTDGILEGSFVMIDTGDVEDPDNAKLYCKGQTGYVYITDLSGAQGIKGEKGEAFTFNDFTQEQLALLKGEKGDPFTYDDFTTEQLAGLKGEKGDPFTYDDFTPEQIASLKGEKGDAFLYSDFTEEQLAALKGEKGDAFTFNDFTPEQIASLKGEKGDAFTYDDFTEEQLAALKGEPFTYDDFTEEQLAGLVGPKGDTGAGIELKGTYDTEEAFRADHPANVPPISMGDAYYVAGDLFTWDENINDWVNRGAIQGPKGDPFTFNDFTEEQLESIRGPQGLQGEKGKPFTYEDFTSEQLEALRGPQGLQGKQGEKGDPFTITKTFSSIAEMDAGFDTDGIAEGSFVMIDTGNVEDEDDAKLFVKGTTAYSFITDLSGASGIKGEKGDAFTYADFTSEQLAALKGDKGDAFKYSDFTEEQLAALKGSPGEKGDSLTYDDMTQEQKDALKDAVVADMGGSLEDYATKEYVEQNGGKIDKILVNGAEQIITNKAVDLQIYGAQIIRWEEND